ncbi:MAG: urease accessory protein UreE [Gammaproteobacteria bacterium]|nr:urease accessory protein UreE [Gammaproteobacteria bacterium]
MLKLTQVLEHEAEVSHTLTMRFEQRTRGRLRVTLDSGIPAGLFLPHGHCLKDGDLLAGDDGVVVRVVAAPEPVCTVRCDQPLQLARVCYHLGNRHVPLQIEADRVRFLQDHVLEQMVRSLGLEPTREQAPFQPEAGAYGRHEHG